MSTGSKLPDPLPLASFEGRLDASLGLPGSKSLTLRDCAIAALADGTSTISFPGECDDYWRMKDCLKRLGVAVDDSVPGRVTIEGRGGDLGRGPVELFVGMSAVSTRLLLAMAALRPDPTTIDGHPSMQARPNLPLVEALRALGAELSGPRDGYLPTRVVGSKALEGPVNVPGDMSSQYLTALLVIAPLLSTGLTLQVEGVLRSQPYVDLTLQEMQRFGVEVENAEYRRLRVEPQAYSARDLAVEGDASAASYWAAMAVLHGGRVALENLGSRTRQGDYDFFSLCERLGAEVRRDPDRTEIVARGGELGGFDADVDMTSMPDVAPTLMMVAPFLSKPTRITGLSTLRVKECDRIAAPQRELSKLGISVEAGADYVVIHPLGRAALERRDAVDIETYHDHRIAMCFGVLGTKLGGLRIRDPGCVKKTYPGFFEDLNRFTGVLRV